MLFRQDATKWADISYQTGCWNPTNRAAFSY